MVAAAEWVEGEHVDWCRDYGCAGCSCGHAFFINGKCRDCAAPQPDCPHEPIRFDYGDTYCPTCDLQTSTGVEMERLYVAGPMTGIPHFNFPAFDEAATALRALGHQVCNPADQDREQFGDRIEASPDGSRESVADTGFDIREALAWDLAWIAKHATGVAVLPGWEDSKGATAEAALGRAIGIPVRTVDEWLGNTSTGEVRTTSSTGGEKGVKLARFDLIPVGPLTALAEHYGRGAAKYADRNWERGYEWSKSFAAMQRHAWAFWGGEDIDPETGSPHVIAVAWHAFSLAQFLDGEQYRGFDDRP